MLPVVLHISLKPFCPLLNLALPVFVSSNAGFPSLINVLSGRVLTLIVPLSVVISISIVNSFSLGENPSSFNFCFFSSRFLS